MTPTIVVDFGDSARGRDALALARSLGELSGARLVSVTSYPRDQYGMLPPAAPGLGVPEEARVVAELAESLLSEKPGSQTRVVGATSRERALQEAAELEQADLIVVSSDAGTPKGQVAAGAAGRRALQGAPCAVALAPAGFAGGNRALGPVGAGFDRSDESYLALARAAGFADGLDTELRVISVLRPPAPAHPKFAFTSYREHLEQLRGELRSQVIEAVDALEIHPAVQPLVLDGEPAGVLAEQTRGLGLLVMGSRGYGPLRRVLLGSVSDALLDDARCPVVIVPRGAERG